MAQISVDSIKAKLRPKLRGKTAWITFFFLSAFLIFLLIYAIQYSQKTLAVATADQSDAISRSLMVRVEQIANLNWKIILLQKERQKLLKEKSKNVFEARRKKKKLTAIAKEIKEKQKQVREIWQNFEPISGEKWQIQFIDKTGKLRYHSSPQYFAKAVQAKLKAGIGVKLNLADKALKPIAKVIRRNQKKKATAWKKQSRVLEKEGYVSVLYPVYANHSLVRGIVLVAKSFQEGKLPKKLLADLHDKQKQGSEILAKLDKFQKDFELGAKAQNPKQKFQFQRKYFFQDKQARKNYQSLQLAYQRTKQSFIEIQNFLLEALKEKVKKVKQRIQEAKTDPEKQKYIATLLIELTQRKKELQELKQAFQTFYFTSRSLLYPLEKGWKKERALYKIAFSNPEKVTGNVLKKTFFGVLETQIFLYDKLQASKKARNQMIDAGIALSIRALFLVFLLSSYFVKDIQRLAQTALKVKTGDLNQTFTVRSKDELKDLADTFNEMLEGLKEREALRAEIETAAIIQKNLLPGEEVQALTDKIDFSFAYKPMIGVGGDYVDLFPLSQNKMCFVIADVSNHGVGPGLVMTMVRSSLRAMSKAGLPLMDLCKKLNEQLVQDTPSNIFVTMLVGYLDLSNMKLEYISCGHNPPVLLSGQKTEFLPAGGMALGAMIPTIFDPMLKSHEVSLKSGQYFVLYTDGLTEAENPAGKMYEEDRLLKLLTALAEKGASASSIVKNMLTSLEKFTHIKLPEEGPTDLKDDVAILAFGKKRA